MGSFGACLITTASTSPARTSVIGYLPHRPFSFGGLASLSVTLQGAIDIPGHTPNLRQGRHCATDFDRHKTTANAVARLVGAPFRRIDYRFSLASARSESAPPPRTHSSTSEI